MLNNDFGTVNLTAALQMRRPTGEHECSGGFKQVETAIADQNILAVVNGEFAVSCRTYSRIVKCAAD